MYYQEEWCQEIKLVDIISLFSLVHSRQCGIFFLFSLSLFLMEIEIENHRQERDKHMEGETKRKDTAKSGEMQTVLDNYIWSDIETCIII